MPAITIRNLSEETHRALKARAAGHHRSTEAEVRAILEAAVNPPGRVAVGSLLAELGRQVGGVDVDPSRETSRDPLDLT